ncbi:cytochrome c oxidase subunit IV [Basidiobolus meristosporus CBS 931.73]|uniref:Cytochrome c oxidase subunit IV n=1 Tax=Basidiobolus meristosporus CBS 931.73 TaxID=1314790 RepID=A0A1Y1YVA7_9FUNG|nr:cytochrome c oxidase subunit IV [Basidiobolus meristosporus CBS 931.73]|eukprot:ORY01941.1 cytochrome c oxidase subunit IV [Basidiobolus meristosporus CBS 931.73]
MFARLITVNAKRALARSASTTSTPALANIRSSWKTMAQEEKVNLYNHLLEAQKGDWKALSLDQQRAAYWLSFGPHGVRKAPLEKGDGKKVFGGVVAVIGISAGLFYLIRLAGQPTPHTFTKEWQEATNEKMKEQKSNPITGISSEDYNGKGYLSFTKEE